MVNASVEPPDADDYVLTLAHRQHCGHFIDAHRESFQPSKRSFIHWYIVLVVNVLFHAIVR
jgi:hypothetical protein